jgi:sarcosine oxidase subunit beta
LKNGVTILGGGVAGCALAWALSRAGRRGVRVFDPGQPGLGSTGKALGGFRTQHGSRLNIELSLASRPFFADRADRVGFQPNGYLYLAEGEAEAEELRRRAALQRALGLPIDHPDPSSLIPFFDATGVVGTNFCRLDGVYSPLEVMRAFREEAEAAGAEFRYGAVAGAEDLDAEAAVVAAGIWSRDIGAGLGVTLAVEPLERGVFQVGPFDWLPRRVPMTLEAGSGYHFREREGRLLVMGPGDQERWDHFREWLQARVPAAAAPQPEAHWTGWYEMTFDQHALVGRTERDGVWASCGFSGHGVMHSPAVAEGLAAMILGETPPVDISPLDPLRTTPLEDTTQL